MIWGAMSSAGVGPLCFLWWFGVQCHLLVLVHCVFWKPTSLHLFPNTFWITSCFLLLTSFLKMLISFSSRILQFHNLSWITEINELFHNILIYWDAPVCVYTQGSAEYTLTGHFIRYTCSIGREHKLLISKSHGSNSMHWGIYMWWRQLAEVQTEHQNGEERGFKWLWTWNGCFARRAGLSISKTADLLRFSCTTLSKVYREWSEKYKISSERQLCGQKCLVDVRGEWADWLEMIERQQLLKNDLLQPR